MKNTLRLSLIALVLLSPLTWSWAEEPAVETEVIESVLDKAKIEQNSLTQIRLKNGRTFEFDSIPNRDDMKAALGLEFPEKVKEQIRAKGGTLEEKDPLAPYESLSEDHKQRFQEMRLQFLSNAARVLNSTKFAFGAGSLVGDSFNFIKIKTKKILGKGIEPPSSSSLQGSFNERSHHVVQAVLKSLDYKLWSQAPLVIDSNEFGVSLSVGVVAETGVLHKGGGGAEEIGFSLAFNKNSRAFVFEIFHSSENFDHTTAAVSVVGLFGKAGFNLGHRSGPETFKGTSFYPPAVPGFSTISSDYFSAGFSSNLGFPPPPIADLLTYTNRFERNTLLRITVSPVVKGYIRIQMGDLAGSLRLVVMRFANVYRFIADKVLMTGRRSCRRAFI